MNETKSEEINIMNTNQNKKKYMFKEIKKMQLHISLIIKLLKFPSGNFISISYDQTIKIWDKNFNPIQSLINEDNNEIYDISIKDDNNFVICTTMITTWEKNLDLFKINNMILNAHKFEKINRVIYCKNDNIISSDIHLIKIWSKSKNIYQCITIIKFQFYFQSFLFLEDQNMLICCGDYKTKFWNILNFSFLFEIKEMDKSNIYKLDDNNILLSQMNNFFKFSLLEKKVIKSCNHNLIFDQIKVINNKEIIICAQYKEIYIYNIDNFELIHRIIDEIFYYNGFEDFNDDSIIFYTDKGIIILFQLILIKEKYYLK